MPDALLDTAALRAQNPPTPSPAVRRWLVVVLAIVLLAVATTAGVLLLG